MKSLATAEFWRQLASLPEGVQQNAQKRIDSGFATRITIHLAFKKVGRVWAVRVARGYRALGLLKDDTIHWFWIGPHDDYEGGLKTR